MKRTVSALGAAVLLLAGCGNDSTLAADDQAFCSDQEDKLDFARQQISELVDGDRHWSSDGEAVTADEVAISPAWRWLDAFNPQDRELSASISRASAALFDVSMTLGPGDDAVFADDAALPRKASDELNALQEFCDKNS